MLTLEGDALEDFVHGLPKMSSDVFVPPSAGAHLINAHSGLEQELRERCARCVADDPMDEDLLDHQETAIAVPRQPRVSIVMWTEYTGAGQAAAAETAPQVSPIGAWWGMREDVK